MAFYHTDFAFGFVLYRRMTGTSRVQEQHQDDLLLNSQVAGSRGCGRSSSMWSYRLRTLSRRLFFSTCTSGIVLNALSVATACQCGHKLHKTLTPSQINVLICIPCTWHAAVERNYYIPSWHGKLARVSRRIFLSLSLLPPEIKKNTAGSRDYWTVWRSNHCSSEYAKI